MADANDKAATGGWGGGQKGAEHPKQKFLPLKCQACPPKLHSPLWQFEDGGLFF